MVQINLHITVNGDSIELFGNEGIKFVKKALDYEKVSTNWSNFSQGFNVPASIINNRIFKHYYNPQIADTFDPFKTNTCEIFANLQSVATGVIRIVDVRVKNNIPTSYRLQFFSDNISLKEKLQDTTISDIDWSIFNHTTSVSLIRDYLSGTPIPGTGVSDELFYPFISTRSLLKWSNPNALVYNNPTSFASSAGVGILFDEFRPSAPISFIVTKLFELAGFEVDNKLELDDTYTKTYLWLNNGEDFVSSSTEQQKLVAQLGKTALLINQPNEIEQIPFNEIVDNKNGMHENGGFRVSITDTYSYKVQTFTDSGNSFRIRRVLNGVAGPWETLAASPDSHTFIEALVSGDFIYIEAMAFQGTTTNVHSTTSLQVSSFTAHLGNMVVGTYVPKMDSIKFLQGVLDMFNSVLYFDNPTGKFIIQNRLDWLDAGNTVNLSKYIDTANKTLRPPTFFNEFNFAMAKGNDLASLTYFDRFLHSHGTTRYSTGNVFGEKFTRELPFTLPQMFQITSDQADPTAPPAATFNIPTTTSVDKSHAAVDPNAMIMIKESPDIAVGGTWKIVDYLGSTATASTVNDFRLQTNSNKSLGFAPTLSTNGAVLSKDTLFKEYYDAFIAAFYNSGVKRWRMSAFIPFGIIETIQPNTILTINNIDYRIDDITTDSKTGRSMLNIITKTV
jgi:hypothetical protein